ncbi:MAG: hypothetical protein JWQ27_1802 [Ferruginibacter sp.]|nr:hypothetical protein [Ferruginibacter sp.]
MEIISQNSGVLSILIPVYNEGRTLAQVLDRVLSVHLIGNLEKELIVINDGSTDDTAMVIRDYIETHPADKILAVTHATNQGKGAAIHSGIAKAGGDYIIIQDADMEYDPAEFNLLLKPALDGFADVVYGSRFSGGKPHRILFYWHTVGNRMITMFCNMLTNLNLTDIETCYKLFRADILKSLSLQEKRFGFEPEVTAKMSRVAGIRIYEVGISYYGRTYNEGKKVGWKDGFRAIYCILRYGLFK